MEARFTSNHPYALARKINKKINQFKYKRSSNLTKMTSLAIQILYGSLFFLLTWVKERTYQVRLMMLLFMLFLAF